jgi:hypothetical protein
MQAGSPRPVPVWFLYDPHMTQVPTFGHSDYAREVLRKADGVIATVGLEE